MASGTPKGKKGKQDEGVLAGLPATRPSRMSRRARSGGPSVESARQAASRAADTRAATGSRASGKRTTAADKTRKPAAAKPAPRAKPKPKAAPAVSNVPDAPEPPRRPQAVRSASPALKDPPRDDVPVARPAQSGTELVTTVVQAAGELASIGLTVGGQIIKRAAQKLPKP